MTDRIVVVGSINMDLVVRSPHLPRPGETILGSDFRTFPGGKGANQAVAASRLGVSVAMIGRVGQDSFGRSMLDTLAADGVDVSGVRQDAEAATGVALITVDAAAENTIIVVPGANSRLTPQDIDEHEALFEGASLLIMQLEIPLAPVRRAIELAHRHGLRVILNPAPAQPLEPSLLAGIDYLIPNEGELLHLTGEKRVEDAIHSAKDNGVGALLVTLGEKGVHLIDTHDARGETHIPAYRVKAVDTTAAGDAFVGAFGVGLAQGKTAAQAAKWACAAAAIAVTRAGAQPSLPTRPEVETFLRENS